MNEMTKMTLEETVSAAEAAYPDTRLFIAGEWREGGSRAALDVVNPATGNVIGQVAKATNSDLDAAVAAAARGFDLWKRCAPLDRATLMRRAAALIRERLDDIAETMTLENGKPLTQARIETSVVADTIDWFAGEAQRTYGLVLPARSPAVNQQAIRLPVGPVAAFTPWNFPLNQIARKVGPALAAGCSIIVKAPEECPASPAMFVQCFIDAGLPADVMGLVYGDPGQISEYMIPHPVIRKLSFTGSTRVGKMLAALAGAHMKRNTMELGGHAPAIVLGDADIDRAVTQLAGHKYRNAGQVCVSPTRFLVEDAVADEFTEKFTAASEALRVGNGLGDVDMGPLANDRRMSALDEMIKDATTRGASLATGGKPVGNAGWFLAPTVLVDVPTDAMIMNEEPFGPVAIINRMKSLDDIVTEANRLPYGLASYAYTGSIEAAQVLKNEVTVGMMSINHIGIGLPEVPFGGVGDSGYGQEGGPEAIACYMDTKFITQHQ